MRTNEMNSSVCIECSVSRSTPWYIFRQWSHAICQACHKQLSDRSRGLVCLYNLCMKCLADDVDENEADYNWECPSCHIHYRASGITRAEHNCLDDEGVFDV